MKTDKNTVIGFVLLGILFFGYFWFSSQQQQALLKEQKRIEDSVAMVKAKELPATDTMAAKAASPGADTAGITANEGGLLPASQGKEELTTVENDLMKIVFTNKGAQPKSFELKRYKTYDSSNVILAGSGFDNIAYPVNNGAGKTSITSDLFFSAPEIAKGADGSQVVSYTFNAAEGESITHQFVIRPKDYMVDWTINMQGADRLLSQNQLNMNWQVQAHRQQSDVDYERTQTRICYVEENDYDFSHASTGASESFSTPVHWLAVKQQFFNATLIAKNQFSSADISITVPEDTSEVIGKSIANLRMQLPAGSTATIPLQLYYGPNDFYVLKKYNIQMENIVDLGSGVFSFVKYINRYIIMPVFDFFAGFISNYGWVIALLTIFIRVVTSPLTYSSYLSGAKMKVLRPELDVLKKKFGDDQQGFAMEQMKLFREAGVNPLGGCIPALLQIPIFFALYSFFNSEIQLRGQSFLWAHDLSSYDVILSLPFSIPLGFGDHVSLFTLLATITSFLISFYNMSMTPDQNNPVMKYMPYVFPFILLFIFNSLPSALTWYYTVSNVITLILQFIIQNYIIDHDKILAKIELTRKKPKVKTKWQQKYDEMMDSQKKVQDLKTRTQTKK